MMMKALERWVLCVADSDWNWIGLSWLRPRISDRVGLGWILLGSVVLGLPGTFVGFGALLFFFGRVPLGIGATIVMLVLSLELVLHVLFARVWNKRAGSLRRSGD